jgi:hypothetical protein
MLPTNKRKTKKQLTFFFEGKLTLTLQEKHNKLFQKRNKSKQNKRKQNNSKEKKTKQNKTKQNKIK